LTALELLGLVPGGTAAGTMLVVTGLNLLAGIERRLRADPEAPPAVVLAEPAAVLAGPALPNAEVPAPPNAEVPALPHAEAADPPGDPGGPAVVLAEPAAAIEVEPGAGLPGTDLPGAGRRPRPAGRCWRAGGPSAHPGQQERRRVRRQPGVRLRCLPPGPLRQG
jgi:hypothetical protein